MSNIQQDLKLCCRRMAFTSCR